MNYLNGHFFIYIMAIYHISKKADHTVQFLLKRKKAQRTPWWSSGQDSRTSTAEVQVQSLVRGIKRSQIVQCGRGRQGRTTIVDNNCKTHPGICSLLIKFIGKQPCPFVYILSTAAFGVCKNRAEQQLQLRLNNPQSLKLLSSLYRKFADPCYRRHNKFIHQNPQD